MSSLVMTETLMGTSCNSFSTLVAVTYTSSALIGSSTAYAGHHAAKPSAVNGKARASIFLTNISPPKNA